MNRHIIWAPSAEIEYCIALQISTTSLKCSRSIRSIYCYFSVSTDHYLPLAFQCLAILGNVILEAGSRRCKSVCHPFPLSSLLPFKLPDMCLWPLVSVGEFDSLMTSLTLFLSMTSAWTLHSKQPLKTHFPGFEGDMTWECIFSVQILHD